MFVLYSPGTTLEQDMCVLLGGGAELSDVRLRVGAASRPAHRSVLAARAAYFEAMFRSFSPQDNIVNVSISTTKAMNGGVVIQG